MPGWLTGVAERGVEMSDDDAMLRGRFEGVNGIACTLASRFVVAVDAMVCTSDFVDGC